MFDIFFNAFMAALLFLTLMFCWKLNRKIEEVKASKKVLLKALSQLDSALVSATNGIGELQTLSSEAAYALQSKVDSAESLSDDLEFLIKSGDTLADRLEKVIRESEDTKKVGAKSRASKAKGTKTTS